MIFNDVYYELYATDGEKACVHTFDTFEEAEEYAEKAGYDKICRIGGNYATFEKCDICENWFEEYELSPTKLCERCEIAGKQHGF